MIQITQKEDCCGCNACGDICQKDAITFTTDEEGFWYPVVDENKCINCGLCEKVCPVLHFQELKHNDFEKPLCYAAENKNLEVVFDSTSGGLFSALADYTYRQGGYVGGAVFNDDFSVSHFISNNKKDLPSLRSSKYLQSNAEGFYAEVKKILSNEKSPDGNLSDEIATVNPTAPIPSPADYANLITSEESVKRTLPTPPTVPVLVCGTPCQMAGLRRYLGKEYQNLIIVDFICLGVNSPLVWRRYLDSFEERYGSPVIYCKAKSKEYGWRNLTQKVILADGRYLFEPKDVSEFTKGYIGTHLYCRPSCYSCKFKGFPRMADITLADFWGIEKFNTQMEKDIGTSLVMINSKKGEEYFEQIKKKINCIQMPFDSILSGNRALTESISVLNGNRTEFFHDIKELPFGDVVKKYSARSLDWKKLVKGVLKSLLRKVRFLRQIVRTTRLHPTALFQTLRYSGLRNLWNRKGILFSTYCTVNIAKTATLEIDGLLVIGEKGRFPKSKLDTRLCVADKGKLSVLGDASFGYGSDIEVHESGHLTIRGKKYVSSGSNIDCTIICADKIDIGADVQIGRNVLIRDNNGNHYINRQGYKNTNPVTIGEKVWLCESCVIMPGVKIGDGAVIGAKSFVITPVPARTLVSGSPAKVIDKDIQWKY